MGTSMRIALVLSFLVIVQGTTKTASPQTAAPAGWMASADRPALVYRATGLPAGKSFVLTIEPPNDLGARDLASWLSSQARADLQKRGATVSPAQPTRNPNGTVTVLIAYRDSAGQTWVVLYAAAEEPGERAQFCSMASNLPASALTEYVRRGSGMFGQQVQQARNGGVTPSGTGTSTRSESQNSGPTEPESSPRASQSVVDVPDSQIEAILHEGRGMTTPTGYRYVESVDLLLKDGSEYSGLTIPPENLDVSSSKTQEPQKWHRWKREGANVLIQDVSGKWTKVDGDAVRPLEGGSALNQKLVHRSATTFVGMGSSVSTQTISFFPTGRFERSSGVLAGSGVVQSAGGFSAGAASSADRNGRRSSASGSRSDASGSVTATSSRATNGDGDATGTYKVSGYALELDCSNGQVQRLLAFYPFAGKADVYIQDVTFNPAGR